MTQELTIIYTGMRKLDQQQERLMQISPVYLTSAAVTTAIDCTVKSHSDYSWQAELLHTVIHLTVLPIQREFLQTGLQELTII
jgi:hypothetical protein